VPIIAERTYLRRLIREPLVQFLILGAGLFLLYGYVGDAAPERADRILVDEAEVARLSEQFQRTWMRPPTREELAGLAEDFVKEEILYREALALGLDRDDLVIRRRMRQKMEFLNADLVEQREPTHEELQAYLDANPGKFRLPARYSFRQIYLGPDGAGGARRAADLLARLRADPALGADPQALGDPTLLPPGMELAPQREIAATFGTEFADVVSGLPEAGWRGPYGSSYGLHLVRLTEKTEGGLPQLGQIRSAVAREWSNERRQAADDRFYQALRERYSVEIRLPEKPTGGEGLAARTR
jgi:hypothetical protein